MNRLFILKVLKDRIDMRLACLFLFIYLINLLPIPYNQYYTWLQLSIIVVTLEHGSKQLRRLSVEIYVYIKRLNGWFCFLFLLIDLNDV